MVGKKEIVAATPGGGLPEWSELKGKLLVIEPEEFESKVDTAHGTADVVRGNLWAINKDGVATDTYEETAIFPTALTSTLKRKIGTYVVGVLTQGEASKGKNAPWLLGEPNEKHLAAAQKFVAALSISSASSGSDDDYAPDEDDDDAF